MPQAGRKLPEVLFESDALRKSARLFRTIHALIERLLSKGISVVLDATKLSERNRDYLYNIADRQGVKLILVRVSAPAELVRERLERRRTVPSESSDADWAVYEKMKTSVESIRRKHYAVDTQKTYRRSLTG